METYFAEIAFSGKDNSSFWFPMFFEAESDDNAKSFFKTVCDSLREAKYAVESKREPKKVKVNSYVLSEIVSTFILEEKIGSFCKLKIKEWRISKFSEAKPFVFKDDFLIKCIDIADKESLQLPCSVENVIPVFKISKDFDIKANEVIVINMSSQLKTGN
ncbi:MAG: hypothetical protein ACE14Q_07540 [Acidobacteriota bacterium]